MKRILAVLFSVLAVAGCRAQVPSNPTTYSCPAATTGTWTALETASTEVTGLTSTDTPGTGNWCYAATSINNTTSPIGQSVASNVVLVTTTASLPVVDLSWTAPTTGTTPTGYILYRIAATASTITAPALATPTTVAANAKPLLAPPATQQVAAVVRRSAGACSASEGKLGGLAVPASAVIAP